MESFLRRVSSIVRKSSDTSAEPDENDDEERRRYFRDLQSRRHSAPHIRRRGIPIDVLPDECDKKTTSSERMYSPTRSIQTAQPPPPPPPSLSRGPSSSISEYTSCARRHFLQPRNYPQGCKRLPTRLLFLCWSCAEDSVTRSILTR